MPTISSEELRIVEKCETIAEGIERSKTLLKERGYAIKRIDEPNPNIAMVTGFIKPELYDKRLKMGKATGLQAIFLIEQKGNN